MKMIYQPFSLFFWKVSTSIWSLFLVEKWPVMIVIWKLNSRILIKGKCYKLLAGKWFRSQIAFHLYIIWNCLLEMTFFFTFVWNVNVMTPKSNLFRSIHNPPFLIIHLHGSSKYTSLNALFMYLAHFRRKNYLLFRSHNISFYDMSM